MNSTNNMSTPTYKQFIQQNEELLQHLYENITKLNEEISYETFCQFVYEYSY